MKLALPLAVSPLATLVLWLAGAASLHADTFVLATGGRVDGTLLNATETPRTKYIIRTGSGGQVTLNRDQVKEVKRAKPGEADYLKLRPQFADTVEDQMKLADWCRERQLVEQRKRHLQRVIELDPEHAKARQALGYAKIDGEWRTREEEFQNRGMIKDETGRYRVPQQIEERKREKAAKEAKTEWYKNIQRWRKWLDTDRAQEALAQFQKIDAPEAVEPLGKQLKDEPVESVRKMYVDAIARIGTPDAWRVLTAFSLDDDDEEIRLSCLDYLEKQTNTGAVGTYIKRLRAKDNAMVNRAGVALGRMKDPSATRPLIDALITTHQFQTQPGNQFNNTFSPGGGTMSFGGGQPQVFTRDIQNPAVRDALVSITGMNFDYDQRAWKLWLQSQKKAQTVDVRRD